MIRKRRGFTLLEMLTAIIVIVMLSAVMIMSTLEVSASADSSNIISDMNLIRTAALMWYKENSSRIVPSTFKIKTNGTEQYFSEFIRDHGSEIMKYIDKNSSAVLHYKNDGTNNAGDYSLIAVNKSKQWYVCCNLGATGNLSNSEDPYMKIKSRLASKAKTLGLRGTTGLNNDSIPGIYTGQQFVCMHVLTLAK